MREEGGTPAIIESIRAGLVFQLKQAVGVDVIRAHEERFLRARRGRLARGARRSRSSATSRPSGSRSSRSWCARPSGRYLHHNFVVALLNDLFGIQSRGGCSCAGPYGHRLLGIDLERSHEFEREITGGCEGIKPGWVRVNFNYFISEAVFDYIDRRGAAGRPRTAGGCCPTTASTPPPGCGPTATAWSSRRCASARSPTTRTACTRPPRALAGDESLLAQHLVDGEKLLLEAGEPDLTPPTSLSADFEHLRWFDLPACGRAVTSAT